MKGDEELVFDFSCDYFCEGKKFYSANVAYVLTNEEVWFKDLAEEIENPVGSVGL